MNGSIAKSDSLDGIKARAAGNFVPYSKARDERQRDGVQHPVRLNNTAPLRAGKIQDLHRVSIMAGITYFVALPFDVADGSVVVGEPIECPSPAAAIERALGLWKIFGHTGAVAFSRTGDPATGDFHDATVLRKFGDVPDDLSTL